MTNSAHFTSNELIAIFGEKNCYFISEFTTNSVETDTRSMLPNSIFVAIKGEKHDSHNFVDIAIEKGTLCLIVEQKWYEINKDKYVGINIITCKNTIAALGKLANFHRSRFDIDIIAVAGSNGKTTTKELISAVLSTEFKVLKTYKNFNNQIGVPLVLFQLDESYGKAVIEIGTNEPGEIYLLSEVLSPTAGIITNLGKEHLEGFGDLDGVEAEETSLFAYLKKSDSVAFVNMDDERLRKYLPLFDNVFTYGQSKEKKYNLNVNISINNDLTSTINCNNQTENFEINLSARGLNYALNSIPAIALGLFYKVPINKIKQALENYKPDNSQEYGRMVIIQTNRITILNDTYNANPSSTMLALETLNLTQTQQKIAVLGDMLELGTVAVEEHKEILAKAITIADFVFTYGPTYKVASNLIQEAVKIYCYDNKEELVNKLHQIIAEDTTILVKGSRGMKMEEIVTKLTK